jgi:hypothetical protein
MVVATILPTAGAAVVWHIAIELGFLFEQNSLAIHPIWCMHCCCCGHAGVTITALCGCTQVHTAVYTAFAYYWDPWHVLILGRTLCRVHHLAL